MRHPPHRSPLVVRALALALLGLAAGGVQAQTSSLSMPPTRSVPSPEAFEAATLVRDARAALRKGQYAKAWELAEEAKDLLDSHGVTQNSFLAREVLAETAVLENRPTEALAAIAPLPASLVCQRLAMTKALALVGLGNLAQARALVLREVGTSEQPRLLRDGIRPYHLPSDDDPSAGALAATAYVIRASWGIASLEYPETIADLRAALWLAPDNPTLQLEYAEALSDTGAYAEAKAELDKLGAVKTGIATDPRFKEDLKLARQSLVWMMTRWPDGPPKSLNEALGTSPPQPTKP